jgi:hypothetical protein
MSAEEPVSWTDRRWASPCVARDLVPLAPRLAPRNQISFANQVPARQKTALGPRWQRRSWFIGRMT